MPSYPAKQNERVSAITLTDMQLHVVQPRKPAHWLRAILKTIRSKKESGRFYAKITSFDPETMTMNFVIPNKDIKRYIKDFRRTTDRLKICVPDGGIKTYLGKDMLEKIIADQKKQNK